mgnify:FL=1
MKKIAAIVVTYNRRDLLIECVDALRKYSPETDIIVVNNASTDGTEDALQEYIRKNQIIYFNTGANIGGAGGFNYGLKVAYQLEYKYFWLMDDDTIVQENSLKEIIYSARILRNKWGFISGQAVWTDGAECKMNRHKIKGNHRNISNEDNGLFAVKQATFVSFFTRRDVVEKVGFPIKEYFIWGDDTEYSLRISKLYPCYYASKSKVVHKMKENKSTAKFYEIDDMDRIQRIAYSVRNDVCTYKRMGLGFLLELLLYMTYNLMLVVIKDNRHKVLKIKIVLKAIKDGLKFKPTIEKIDC